MIPEGFLDTDEPITVDEAQKCPEILTAIKRKWIKREWQDDFYCPALLIFPSSEASQKVLQAERFILTCSLLHAARLGAILMKNHFFKSLWINR